MTLDEFVQELSNLPEEYERTIQGTSLIIIHNGVSMDPIRAVAKYLGKASHRSGGAWSAGHCLELEGSALDEIVRVSVGYDKDLRKRLLEAVGLEE